MAKIFFFTIGCLFSALVHAEIIPSNLSEADRVFVAPFLAQTYGAQYAARPFYVGNNNGFEFGVSTQYRSLFRVQQKYSSDDIDSSLVLSHLYLNKSLIYGVELGLTSVAGAFSSSVVSGFGGHLRWYPDFFSNKKFQSLFQIYAEFINYEDAFFNRDLGLNFALGYNLKKFSLSTGLDYVFTSASFAPIANARTITDSGKREEVHIQNASPFLSIQFHFKKLHINLVESYNFDTTWMSRINLTYTI